jgi:hypothetical protein
MTKIISTSLHQKSFILLFTIIIIIGLQTIALAQDISISDFRIPETKYQRLLGGLSGDFYRTDQNYFSPSTPYDYRSDETNQAFSMDLNGSYIYGKYNEDRSLELSLRMNTNISHNTSNDNWESSGFMNGARNKSNSYTVYFNPFVRYSSYLTADLWHLFIEGSGNSSYQERRDNHEDIQMSGTTKNSLFNKYNQWNASVSGGLGYGKMRDGTPVFVVIRILNKLEEDSLITRPLLKNEILSLVNILAKKIEYTYSQDRYVKFLMEDVFSELQKLGVLKNNITAYSVLKSVEVLSENIEPRLFGWRGRLGVQRSFSESVYGYSDSLYRSRYYWYSSGLIQLSFDFGYPVSLNTHLSSNVSMSIPGIDYKRKIIFSFTASCIYQLGERIDAKLSFSGSRNHFLMSNQYDQDQFLRLLRYSAGLSFRFFIENNISFDVNCTYWKSEQHRFSPTSPSRNISQSPQITFGINYRFI